MQTVYVPVSEDEQYDGAYISNDGQSLCRLKPIQAVLLSKEDADRMEWIPVSERLPDFDVKVLVFGEQIGMNPQMGGAYISISKRQELGGRVRNGHLMQDENQFSLMSYVTHWMPLPEKPKK
jgi:hypothetical protein